MYGSFLPVEARADKATNSRRFTSGPGGLPAMNQVMVVRQETAALQDFNSPYVGLGS
jgi:hypothetical protein